MCRFRRLLRCPASLPLTVAIVLAGCQEPFQAPPSFLAERPPLGSAAGARVPTIDDQFAALTSAIPGFGGLFYDSSHRLTVYLKRPETLPAVRPQLQQFLASIRSADPARLAQVPQEVAAARALPARYDFAELDTWYRRQIVPFIGGLDGVTMTDIDERVNQITVGVRDAAAKAQVEGKLEGLSVPADAVRVIEFPPVYVLRARAANSRVRCRDMPRRHLKRRTGDGRIGRPPTVEDPAPHRFVTDPSLTDWVRPVPGGMEIENGDSLFQCTLAYNLVLQGDPYNRYFLTNSHCSDVFGSVTQTPLGQPG